jgi:hypothetical protein
VLWKHYVFRRGPDVHEMWDSLFERRPLRVLYIAGRGFDTRAQGVLAEFVRNLQQSGTRIETAELLLIGYSGYRLSEELRSQTLENADALSALFEPIGKCTRLTIGASGIGEEDETASSSLRRGTEEVLKRIDGFTDVIIDVSSMPRVSYLALITGVLHRLIPNKDLSNCLHANGVNLQVLVAEDPKLDAQIKSEDPSNDLTTIPGFSSALYAETVQDWPFVWFPVLGENRVNQLEKVLSAVVPDLAEICPVLPHPSQDPRRGDRLLVEYKRPLFDSRQTPIGNIIYAHESNPFEAYRQVLNAMRRYQNSLSILGGCRLVVTPLGSKLITVGVGLACFEMRPTGLDENYAIAIPYAGPTRYAATPESFKTANAEIAALLLTGSAYGEHRGHAE